jgi:hypothetical protein
MTPLVTVPPKRPRNSPGDPFRIFECARSSGLEGRKWVEANLSPRAQRAARCSLNSVAVMRQKRIADGRAMLDQAHAEIAELSESTHPAMCALIERWYQSATGYYHYALKDFRLADESMVRAQEAVVDAISRQPLLLPFASGCSELHMNRARVASSRRQWKAMKEHIELGVEMGMGRLPFCTLLDGTEVWLSDVQDFIRALPAEVTGKWEELPYILDQELNRRYFDRIVRQITGMTKLAIQYN